MSESRYKNLDEVKEHVSFLLASPGSALICDKEVYLSPKKSLIEKVYQGKPYEMLIIEHLSNYDLVKVAYRLKYLEHKNNENIV